METAAQFSGFVATPMAGAEIAHFSTTPRYSPRNWGDGRFVTSLPGLSRATIIKIVIGAISDEIDCPKSHLDILAAGLTHGGYHSNFFWSSMLRLATLASKPVSQYRKKALTYSTKTAERAMKFWNEIGVIRLVTDPEERLRGPGEHDFVDAGKKKIGRGPVCHWDISGLLKFLPRDLREMLEALVLGAVITLRPIAAAAPERDVDALYSPFEETKHFAEVQEETAPQPQAETDETFDPFGGIYPSDEAIAAVQFTSTAPSAPQPLTATDLDPFARDYPEQLAALEANSLSSDLDLPNLALVPSAGNPPRTSEIGLLIAASLSLPANLSINAPRTSHEELCNVQQTLINNEGEQANRSKTVDGSLIFTKTNLSAISDRSTRARGGQEAGKEAFSLDVTGLDSAGLGELLIMKRAGIGKVDLRGAKSLVSECPSEKFLRELLVYAAWCGREDGDEKAGGWILQAGRACFPKPEPWPKPFIKHLEELRLQKRAESSKAAVRAAAEARIPEGVTDYELRKVWPNLEAELVAAGIPGTWLGMHFPKVSGAVWEGRTVAVEVSEAFSYRMWTAMKNGGFKDVFATALGKLLRRTVAVRFTAPESEGTV